MTNRIDACFSGLRAKSQKAFVAYITAGDPTLDVTVGLVLALEQAGVDVVELGVPFSDPLADGVVNQLAAQRALEGGASVRGFCVRLKRFAKNPPFPLSSLPISIRCIATALIALRWRRNKRVLMGCYCLISRRKRRCSRRNKHRSRFIG